MKKYVYSVSKDFKESIYQLLSGGVGDGEKAQQLSPACGRLPSAADLHL